MAPVRIMTPVESMLRTSLVAVPAFMRVEPVTTSGPGTGATGRAEAFGVGGGAGFHACRTGDNLGASNRRDGEVGDLGDGRGSDTGEADGESFDGFCVEERAEDVGSSSAGRDADEDEQIG